MEPHGPERGKLVEYRNVLALHGPNIWARVPVLEAQIDLGEFRQPSGDAAAGVHERLRAWLPAWSQRRRSADGPEPTKTILALGTILGQVALTLQDFAGTPVGFSAVRTTRDEVVLRVVVEYEQEELGALLWKRPARS